MIGFRKQKETIEEEEKVEGIVEEEIPLEQSKNLEGEVLKFLKREFTSNDAPESLKAASSLNAPPLFTFRGEDFDFSIWYRLPIRGETGITHIPDFVVFKGAHRISPREKNPDIIIECRKLPPDQSNRTDPRIVKDLIGCSLDTLPAVSILVTNRCLSNYATALAKDYGIGLVAVESSTEPQSDLYRLITMDGQPTREKLRKVLHRNIYKLENYYRIKEPVGKSKIELKKGRVDTRSGLRERILKVLRTKPGMDIVKLSSILGVHSDYILNELHILEREEKVKVSKKSDRAEGYKYDEWTGLHRDIDKL